MGGWADERAKTAKSVSSRKLASNCNPTQILSANITTGASSVFDLDLPLMPSYRQVRIQSAAQIAPPSAYGMGGDSEDDDDVPAIPDLDDVQARPETRFECLCTPLHNPRFTFRTKTWR